jgi:hypothetical protein
MLKNFRGPLKLKLELQKNLISGPTCPKQELLIDIQFSGKGLILQENAFSKTVLDIIFTSKNA